MSESGIGGIKEVIAIDRRARASTAGSSTRAACTACSACRRPRRAAASTRPPPRSRCCPRPRKSTSRSTRRTCAIDTFCSSGPGGQSVNTTYSAVRITHIPTGLVVSQQDEKSQIKNRAKAMKVLRARLYEMEMQKQQDAIAKDRRSQVGTGERSEKIRTYNFPQNRITDHRINFTTHQLTDVLNGDLDELIDEVVTHFTGREAEGSDGGPEPVPMTAAMTPCPSDDAPRDAARARLMRGRHRPRRGRARRRRARPARPRVGPRRFARARHATRPRRLRRRLRARSSPAARAASRSSTSSAAASSGASTSRSRPTVLAPRPETELIVEEALDAACGRPARAPPVTRGRRRHRQRLPRRLPGPGVARRARHRHRHLRRRRWPSPRRNAAATASPTASRSVQASLLDGVAGAARPRSCRTRPTCPTGDSAPAARGPRLRTASARSTAAPTASTLIRALLADSARACWRRAAG